MGRIAGQILRIGGSVMKRLSWYSVTVLLVFFIHVGFALADKSAASLEVPQTVQKGSEVTIRVTVTHSSNTASHYTEWLKVAVNQKEIARWDYTSDNRPEAAVFTKEIKVQALENMEVTAQSSCNIHGSKGPTTAKISVKE